MAYFHQNNKIIWYQVSKTNNTVFIKSRFQTPFFAQTETLDPTFGAPIDFTDRGSQGAYRPTSLKGTGYIFWENIGNVSLIDCDDGIHDYRNVLFGAWEGKQKKPCW